MRKQLAHPHSGYCYEPAEEADPDRVSEYEFDVAAARQGYLLALSEIDHYRSELARVIEVGSGDRLVDEEGVTVSQLIELRIEEAEADRHRFAEALWVLHFLGDPDA